MHVTGLLKGTPVRQLGSHAYCTVPCVCFKSVAVLAMSVLQSKKGAFRLNLSLVVKVLLHVVLLYLCYFSRYFW